jgi:hypothetical protein
MAIQHLAFTEHLTEEAEVIFRLGRYFGQRLLCDIYYYLSSYLLKSTSRYRLSLASLFNAVSFILGGSPLDSIVRIAILLAPLPLFCRVRGPSLWGG